MLHKCMTKKFFSGPGKTEEEMERRNRRKNVSRSSYYMVIITNQNSRTVRS